MASMDVDQHTDGEGKESIGQDENVATIEEESIDAIETDETSIRKDEEAESQAKPKTNPLTCTICSDMYTNARDLSCGHTFCLHCLHSSKPDECPQCGEKTVPERFEELKPNSEKNSLVRLEMTKRIENSYHRDRKDDEVNNYDRREKHDGVVCDHCEKKDFTGIRYVCGVCPRYNLCEKCEDNPKEHKHDKTHIFVKLKRPAANPIPEGPLLHEVGVKMGEAMDLDRKDHRVLEKVGPSTYKQLSQVSCDRCTLVKSAIKGDCYYCGYCLNYNLCSGCEKRSDILHDPNHVFLKVKHAVNKQLGDEKTQLLKHVIY